jgi:acetylornithine deacetylase/succinyl-diaminopimelate desuccinylase-like protein
VERILSGKPDSSHQRGRRWGCLPLAREIQQIPAPTFNESERASFVEHLFREAGVGEVSVVQHDDIVNVYAVIPGRNRETPVLLVSAHTDTVFPHGTKLDSALDGSGRFYGPGIGDNSIAVAALVLLARDLAGQVGSGGGKPPCDVWFVANAAEEGLGDLRGMHRAIEKIHDSTCGIGAAIVVEGMALGCVYHHGIAVRRHEVRVSTEGGHSWGDHGAPSAIHELLRLGAEISRLPVSAEPRTTLNIGIVSGGTSVNTIANEARMEIDLRSEETQAVEALQAQVLSLVEAAARDGVEVEVRAIGNRPAGHLPAGHPLVTAATAALESIGMTARFPKGSTDANALLARGVPAVCVGVTTGGNPHRTDEWIDTGPVELGMQQLHSLLIDASEIAAGTEDRGA